MTWDECRPFHSYIRAAVDAGIPPKQLLFCDPTHKEYDYWDLRLLQAFRLAEDFSRNGIPIWWDESSEVNFEIKRKVSRSQAALDRAQQADQGTGKQKKTPVPGRYYVPVPKKIGGGNMPTFVEWQKEQARLGGSKKT